MQFKILTGLDFDTDFLTKIMDLDREVYSQEYVGELENMVSRYEKTRDSFVCIIDETRDKLAGYINFFPCTKELYEDIRFHTTVIRDDDIRPDEVALYSEEGNHLFIISLVVAPEYRHTKDAITALSDAWIAHMNGLAGKGYPITDICAIAVSEDGKKALRNYMFIAERKLDDGNTVFVCENRQLKNGDKADFLKKLLAHELYFKSYQSDIYLMLPLAENVKNHRLDVIIDKSRTEDVSGYVNEIWKEMQEKYNGSDPFAPEVVTTLVEGLKNCIDYEVSNDVRKELDTVFLGCFYFLHTTDNYPLAGKNSEREEESDEEIVVGEEPMYAILAAHRPSHMYVLTLFLPDSPYSTTQVQDQLSYGYLKIRNPKDDEKVKDGPTYIDIYEYIRLKYGLLKCGDGKTLLCMSGKPKDPREFQNILSGEVYNSMHIDYHIQSKEIEEMCSTDHAQYDYYEVYHSDVVIAFILKEFSEDVHERIELTATYAFIAQLVMFQNTSIAKTNIKITNALANSGDITYEQIHDLYTEFGKTVRFWEIRNFKYNGTQAEAACITKAFSNEELKQTYYEHQEFLKQIVELETARTEARNGTILNIVMAFLTVIQIQDFAVGMLADFYGSLGIEAIYAQRTFMTILISSAWTILLCFMILRKIRRKTYRHNMTNERKE